MRAHRPRHAMAQFLAEMVQRHPDGVIANSVTDWAKAIEAERALDEHAPRGPRRIARLLAHELRKRQGDDVLVDKPGLWVSTAETTITIKVDWQRHAGSTSAVINQVVDCLLESAGTRR